MEIAILQHVDFEGPVEIENWCRQTGNEYKVYRLFLGEALPKAERTDFLVILGGPMSVLDELPWLEEERQLIRVLISQGKPVFGVCLGGQQIAKTLGADIFQGEYREAGWLPIRTIKSETLGELPEELVVFHWHGEQFGLPEGAERLFTSEVCPNQGFIYKENVIGLQFHFESTKESIESILQNDAAFLDGTAYTQTSAEIRNYPIPASNRKLLYRLLDRLKATVPD
ncbi:GMP synthase-Glutamine amidotransferase [Trichococcus flocculiformis]|uniref:type 1 glutamine amidotransferase n=1 Tax=Trichococcus TaxID=82802 RepID=UPI0007A8105D|nr:MULTISPECIES: type 1 glutamine amidotransferase [Trichococcus]CZR01113.1 glutamine amidotransferase [Trichococcus sp. ES5]SHF65359.1 GMP synthase-Glutamine amidotransferase [Trichococcus flocculiformis]